MSAASPITSEPSQADHRPQSAIPSATYRLQLHKEFTLDDAAALVNYFCELGVSHLYLSPIQVARSGSLHGYDVVDHRAINPELGGEPALRRLSTACRQFGIGLIVDIVPNHMAIGNADNLMWLDVLENGPSSDYAGVFDIDFNSADAILAGKVIVPVLGEPYSDALKDGKLVLAWDASICRIAFFYGPHRFPLRPEDYAAVTANKPPAQADLSAWSDPDSLHNLLEQQNFRLTWWNAAGDIINWRRFFDVNELAALRMEDSAVFQLTHDIILRLYANGIIDGVRVDHVDGLADPKEYLERLHKSLCERTKLRPPGAGRGGPYIVVEKILGVEEALPSAWPVHGTTGYDFMDQISALQHDPAGEATLLSLWSEISGRSDSFDAEETAARTEVLQGAFAGQLAACAAMFASLAQREIETRDLTSESFRRALVAFISRLRRYRSYATGSDRSPALDSAIEQAIETAKEASPADAASLDFILGILEQNGVPATAEHRDTVRRLNQLTAPVAAKAVEDTAFYRYSRLLSRNDVGFDASRFSATPEQFLSSGQRRVAAAPFSMLTTATHDHKRGEDVRARLAVLSEVAAEWSEVVTGWLAGEATERPESVPAEDAYALFQTLVGAWPLALAPDDASGLKEFATRVAQWQKKSLREAKLRTSWAAPDNEFEAASAAWLDHLLDPQASPAFLKSLTDLVNRIAPAGATNGVVQAVLRCTWPGVPDLYQGAELWEFSLVDPDNRRPVDYAVRRRLLAEQGSDWLSGAIKQHSIARLLHCRRNDPALFTVGRLNPIAVRGSRSLHILAFAREHEGRVAETAVMLHVAGPVRELGQLPPAEWWGDTEVQIGGSFQKAWALFERSPVYFSSSVLAKLPA